MDEGQRHGRGCRVSFGRLMSRVSVTITDGAGNTRTIGADYEVQSRVRGGIYFGNNADIRMDTVNRGTNITAIQQYRSAADASFFPGYQKEWLLPLMSGGATLNMVAEVFKSYGGGTGVQNFTVEGRSYSVPAPNMRYRLNIENALAYGYDQYMTGRCDGLLHRMLYQIRTNLPANANLVLQIESEVDTNNATSTSDTTIGAIEDGISYTRAQCDVRAVEAIKYIVWWLRNPPAGIAPLPSRVKFSMGYAGQWSGTNAFFRTHPESLMSLLDYMHMNTYNRSGNRTAYVRFREIADWIDRLGLIGRTLPIIVSEFGSNAAFTPNQAGYMAQMPSAITQLNSELRAIGRGQFAMTIWFGSNSTEWGVLSPKEEGLVALKTMLATPPYA